MKIFLAGEGVTELGDWAWPPSYRANPPDPGVLEALLEKVRAGGWEIEDAVIWKHIRKIRSGKHRKPEQRNVLGAALMAHEAGCEALVFSRDRDGDSQRENRVEAAVEEATEMFSNLQVAGGVAIEMVEAWLLALKRKRASESHADPERVLADTLSISNRAEKVEVVREANLDQVPNDASSLRLWLKRTAAVLESG